MRNDKCFKMVNEQIITRGIQDQNVINAMRKVKRHLFVPQEFQSEAYDDEPLPIGYGQTISQPFIVAYMTELAKLNPDDRVLEIGTGSGYQTAIIAEIVREVYSIELIDLLSDRSQKILSELGYKNIYIKCDDGYNGWPEKSPFDVILVTAAPREIPYQLLGQLAEKGRMVIPVGSLYQELCLITKNRDKFKKESLIPVKFVPMVHKNG